MKGFTTERKILGKAITMQILRFEFSDSSDCLAEKGGMVLAKDSNVISCNVTFCQTQTWKFRHLLFRALVVTCDLAEKDTYHSEHDYKCIAAINK